VSLTPTPLLTSISMTALTTPRAHTQLTASLTHLASPEPKADGGNGQSNATAKLYDEYSVPHDAEQPSWHAAAARRPAPPPHGSPLTRRPPSPHRVQDLSEELRHNAPLLVRHHLHRGVMQSLRQARRALALALALTLPPRLLGSHSHCIPLFPHR
jgi:hypothetical protein